MKISRKFDIYTFIVAAVFIAAFLISYRTISTISTETSRLFDISKEFDYLTHLKQTLIDLEHSTEHYLELAESKGYSNAVMKDLAGYEQALRMSSTVKLDDEEKELVQIALIKLPQFTGLLEELIRAEGRITEEHKAAYRQLRVDYIEKTLAGINEHWKEDLEKVTRLSERARQSKSRALTFLIILAAGLSGLLIVARIIVSRSVVRPLGEIEEISNAIAGGDIKKRIFLTSDDELGSLSTSVNVMAAAMQDKLEKLEDAVNKEQALVREQTILSELMGFIASGAELEVVLRIFLGRTRDLMRAGYSAIFIMEPRDPLDPELKFFINTFEEHTGMECGRSMLKGVFINVVRTLTPLRVNTPLTETPMMHVDIRNLIAIPLSSIDKGVLGLVVIINKDGGFTQSDEDMLFNFSFQAFQAITMQQEIIRYATTDGLTGLHNHRVFREKLHEEIERSRRYSRDISLLMLDIDHFKNFNDTYGHQAGDTVLRAVSALIQNNIRTTDFEARYGGEEFAVILPETSGSQARIVAERLRTSIAGYVLDLGGGEQQRVTVSLGYATFPPDADTDEMLIKKADEMLYASKHHGRNRVTGFGDGTLPPPAADTVKT
ncbi:MAG: hypothetical protein C0402_10395 [Thermodesulfovibrio sp.]|nr:hypothetical protein [Thermodesulfovibrio sp.]